MLESTQDQEKIIKLPQSSAKLWDICDSNNELSELLEEILNKGKALKVRVTGESMRGSINSGDVVQLEKVKYTDLRIGDLLLFKSLSGNLVLHRLLRRYTTSSGDYIQTKGDSLTYMDTSVPIENILGRATVIERCTGSNRQRLDTSSFTMQLNNYLKALFHILWIVCRKALRSIKRT